MPFKKGDRGNPLGRPKGSPNKIRKFDINRVCETMDREGCDPFKVLCELALTHRSGMVRVQAASALCSYVLPRLKSVDFKTDQQSNFTMVLNMNNKPLLTVEHPSEIIDGKIIAEEIK